MAEAKARRRRQRSDARQSIGAVLDAAVRTLAGRPDASVDEIARAAGVSRQTVYAHFPSRDALIDAVTEQASAEFTALLDGLDLSQAPPAQALTRLLDAGWQTAARYPFLWLQPAVDPGKDAARHAPVLDRMLDIVRRGQASGDFDASVPAHWLLSASLALGRAAEDEVKAGRMTIEQATHAIRQGFLRLLGAVPGPDASPENNEDNRAGRGKDGEWR
jgi:AcrR family transcriptional regulator